MELKRISRLAMLLALSVVLSLLESLIVINNVIPGAKLGLANVIILIVLYIYSFKDAVTLSLTRVFLVGILRTGLFSVTFFFSLGGAILSVLSMYLAKRFLKLSVVGVSIVGAATHCLGQVIMGGLILNTTSLMYYFPILLAISIPTGIVVGLISKEGIHYLKEVS